MPWVEPCNGGWRVVWREGGAGSERKKSQSYNTKSKAAAEARRIDAELSARRKLPPGGRVIPWPEVAQRWRDSRTPGRYRDASLAALLRLDWETVADATPATLRLLNPYNLRVAKAALEYARVYLEQPVDRRAADVSPPRRPRKQEVQLLSEDEVWALVRQCGEVAQGNGALAHVLATYGHRAENLVRLRASAVDDRGWLRLIVKGGDQVAHPLTEKTLAVLEPLRSHGADDYLFPSHLGGEPFRTGQEFAAWFYHRFGVGYYQAFKRWAISRMLRPTTAGGLGLDAKTVASITGHRTVSLLLNTYARTSDALKANAIAALADDTTMTPR